MATNKRKITFYADDDVVETLVRHQAENKGLSVSVLINNHMRQSVDTMSVSTNAAPLFDEMDGRLDTFIEVLRGVCDELKRIRKRLANIEDKLSTELTLGQIDE